MKEVIKLKAAAKHYVQGENVIKALDGVNISIYEGEFVAIMGPSGSGKSTAMNLTGSLDTPTKGHIFLDGKDISKLTESELAVLRGKKIGFIFQQFNLIANLTAKENVALPMMFQGMTEAERIAKAEQLLEQVDLTDRMHHYPNELSGGQQQRVAIARSLANDPEVLLADEPTGNLDTKTGDIVMKFLSKMHDDGKTVVFITHEPDLATKYANKIYWLRDGQIEKTTIKKGSKWTNDGNK